MPAEPVSRVGILGLRGVKNPVVPRYYDAKLPWA